MKFKVLFRSFVLASTVAFAFSSSTAAFALQPAMTSQSVSAQPTVKVHPGRVEINVPGDEPKQVVIYSLTGQVIKSFTAQPGVTSIDLSAGYYIVKCERTSTRVVVK